MHPQPITSEERNARATLATCLNMLKCHGQRLLRSLPYSLMSMSSPAHTATYSFSLLAPMGGLPGLPGSEPSAAANCPDTGYTPARKQGATPAWAALLMWS